MEPEDKVLQKKFVKACRCLETIAEETAKKYPGAIIWVHDGTIILMKESPWENRTYTPEDEEKIIGSHICNRLDSGEM